MAVNPIFVIGVHLSEGFRQVHLLFCYDFWGNSGKTWVFRYESSECRYESERKVHIISFAVAEMLFFSTFVTRVGLQSILWTS